MLFRFKLKIENSDKTAGSKWSKSVSTKATILFIDIGGFCEIYKIMYM